MSAYILVIISLVGGSAVSQQEYANIESCQNAGAVIARMSAEGRSKPRFDWVCLPKDFRTN